MVFSIMSRYTHQTLLPLLVSLAFFMDHQFYDNKFSVSTLDCRRQCWRENCSERINGSVEALLGSGNLRCSHPWTALQRLDLPSLPFQLLALRRLLTTLCPGKRHLYSGDRNSHSYPQRWRTQTPQRKSRRCNLFDKPWRGTIFLSIYDDPIS